MIAFQCSTNGILGSYRNLAKHVSVGIQKVLYVLRDLRLPRYPKIGAFCRQLSSSLAARDQVSNTVMTPTQLDLQAGDWLTTRHCLFQRQWQRTAANKGVHHGTIDRGLTCLVGASESCQALYKVQLESFMDAEILEFNVFKHALPALSRIVEGSNALGEPPKCRILGPAQGCQQSYCHLQRPL